MSISGGVGGNISGNGIKSKGNSIDFTNWNEGNNNTGYNNSITELLQNMISNGSIDFNSFSNMSNQQRRDSILKIINDQNSLRSQRSSSDQSRNTNASLREDIFDRRNPSQSQQQPQSLEKLHNNLHLHYRNKTVAKTKKISSTTATATKTTII